jgi:hypothetical protein
MSAWQIGSQYGSLTIITWVLLLATPLLLWWFLLYVRSRKSHTLRPIPAFHALRGLLGRTVEEGKRVHVSLGRSGVGGDQTAVVSAALEVLHDLADQGACIGVSPIVTVADPVLMLVVQDAVYRACQRRENVGSYVDTDVQMIAPTPSAYAVGALDVINDHGTGANVMVGHLGDEYLLLGEPGAQRDITQVVGSDVLETQALLGATSDRVLWGEEMFAAGAYLGGRPAHIASLYVQDTIRVLVVIAIVIGILLKTLS